MQNNSGVLKAGHQGMLCDQTPSGGATVPCVDRHNPSVLKYTALRHKQGVVPTLAENDAASPANESESTAGRPLPDAARG